MNLIGALGMSFFNFPYSLLINNKENRDKIEVGIYAKRVFCYVRFYLFILIQLF